MNKDFEVLLKAEEENPELKLKAEKLEKRLQKCVMEYVTLAAEYGVTLDVSDFNPAGELLLDEDPANVTE